jgi:hypothetical protein
MNTPKAWWASKTIWTNLVALVGALLISMGTDPGRWAEISTVLLAAINVALRLVTDEPVSLNANQEP